MDWYINHCFRCNQLAKDGDIIAFTREFDAIVCESCYDKIMEGKETDDEALILKKEWEL